jgi:outer membrane protein OmpA-like peptidoglycan-associated protein
MTQEVRLMNQRFTAIVICGAASLLVSACATKGFVREQVTSTETRLVQRADSTEGKLRETSDRTASNTQAIEAAGQRLTSLDGRIGEVSTIATEAKKDAATVAAAQRDAEAQFNQRFKDRNKYSMVEQKIVFFDFNKADLRDEGMNELEDVARALKADPNGILELQGFADQRGTDKYNYQLTRDRVDAVVRYLVQRHNIDLRRIHAVGMGKAALAQGEKGGKETFAKSRRVEIRLLAPQS